MKKIFCVEVEEQRNKTYYVLAETRGEAEAEAEEAWVDDDIEGFMSSWGRQLSNEAVEALDLDTLIQNDGAEDRLRDLPEIAEWLEKAKGERIRKELQQELPLKEKS